MTLQTPWLQVGSALILRERVLWERVFTSSSGRTVAGVSEELRLVLSLVSKLLFLFIAGYLNDAVPSS